MASHAQVETSKTITGKTVATALQDHSFWSVPFHDAPDDGLENRLVGEIIYPVAKREINSIMLALPHTDVAKLTGSREVFSIFMERDRHNTVRGVESLFNTIAVMHVNVDVKDSLLETQQFEDTENNI